MIHFTSESVEMGSFYGLFADLFREFSVKPLPAYFGYTFLSKSGVPESLRDYLDTVYSVFGDVRLSDSSFYTDPPEVPLSLSVNNKVLLGFSGGKDSVATAIRLQQQGYDVTLYSLRGINRAYSNVEAQTAVKMAGMLGMPLIERSVSFSGMCDWIENPIKNHLILAAMVEFGKNHDFSMYSFGNHQVDYPVSTAKPDIDLSDAAELYDKLVPFYRQFIPRFKVLCPLQNTTESYTIILDAKGKEFLYQCQSCLCIPYRKNNIRKSNKERFDIDLPDGRCGSCRKCAREYLHTSLFGGEKFNRAYFQHCIQVTRKYIEFLTDHVGATKWTKAEAKALTNEQVLDFFVDRATLDARVYK